MNCRRARGPLLLASFLITLVSGCQSTKGVVSDGRYESPLKDFSLAIPVTGPGLKIEDGVSPTTADELGSAWVSFHDDFGNLVALEAAAMPEKFVQTLNDPARVSEHLKDFFREAFVPSKRAAIPDLKTSHEESMTLRGGVPALFAVIDYPGGSAMVAVSAEHPRGKRMDSTRPQLLFVHGSMQYILSTAHDIQLGPGEPVHGADADAAQIARWKAELVKIYESIEFH
jgi:hypothetical protein